MKTPFRCAKNVKQFQDGFSLLEVLVAIVVVAIGILGIAGLQASALKFSKASEGRTSAVQLSQDLLERMRVNIHGTNGGEYDALATATASVCLSAIPSGGGVTSAQDAKRWQNAVACTLPEGVGRATVTPAATSGDPSVVTVVIQWNESRIKGGSSTFSYSVTSLL